VKKIFVVLLIAILVVFAFAPARAEGKKPITPPQLREITFIHYATPDDAPAKGKPQPTLPPPDNNAYKLLGLYLPDTATYKVNLAGAPAGALTEVGMAFETWDKVTSKELFTDLVETTTISGLSYDYQNTISWVGIAPTNIIAMTRVWYNDDGNPDTLDEVLEFDVVFNALLKWGIDPDGEGPTTIKKVYDVRNIATHEAGHVVGLDDLYESQYRELTMYGYSSKGETKKISLQQGDVNGTIAIYGS
jgi:hypothetical protein